MLLLLGNWPTTLCLLFSIEPFEMPLILPKKDGRRWSVGWFVSGEGLPIRGDFLESLEYVLPLVEFDDVLAYEGRRRSIAGW